MSMSLECKIGQRLRLARQRAGLSVTELAERTLLPPERIDHLESGDARFDAKLICQLATSLGIEIRWFFEESGGKGALHRTRDDSQSRNIHDLVAHARSTGFLESIMNAEKPNRRERAQFKAA